MHLLSIFTVFGAMIVGVLFLAFPVVDIFSLTKSLGEKPCVHLASTISNKTVILRVDDIQAYAWGETSQKMITDASVRNIPLTLGVIPIGLKDDTEFVTFLKSHACKVEFALHGLTHDGGEYETHPEFGTSTQDEAYNRIVEGREILKEITSDLIVTWIPPLNVHSSGTIDALNELNFTHLSSEGEGIFDYDAATFSYVSDSLVSPLKVVDSCLRTFEKSTYCIVMLHPQDFADGLVHSQEKYESYYLELLDAFTREGVTFSRLKDIPL